MAVRHNEHVRGSPAAGCSINPIAFGDWVVDFVRENNRLAGILRDPSPAEIGAHRGLLAARTLRVEHLTIFVHHVQASAKLRADAAAGEKVWRRRASVYAALEGIILTAQEGLFCPYRLYRLYMLLRPFTDANGRSGRALWLWQVAQTTTAGSSPGYCQENAFAKDLHTLN